RGLGGGLLGLLLLGLSHGLPDLEPDALELAGQLLDVLLVELVLEGERLELDGLEVAPLLSPFDELTSLVGIKQFVKLVLGQKRPFRAYFVILGHLRTVGGFPFCFQGEPCRHQPTSETRPCFVLFRRRRLFGLRAHGEFELDLVLVVQDEPRPKRFASTGAEAGQYLPGPTFLDELSRNFRRQRAARDPFPYHEAAPGLLAALPARAAVGLRVLPDDLARLGAAPRAEAELGPLGTELFLVQSGNLVDRLLREGGDALHEGLPVAVAVLDLGEPV